MTHMMHMKRAFADALYTHMSSNPRIWVVSGDLGYKMWDEIARDFPDRFINTGASEQAMVDIAVGLALQGHIPFVYSMSSFVLYRPFESLRNYLNHEQIPVKLVGSGRGLDYEENGFSHWAHDDKQILKALPRIVCFWPSEKDNIKRMVDRLVHNGKPSYINLRRY